MTLFWAYSAVDNTFCGRLISYVSDKFYEFSPLSYPP